MGNASALKEKSPWRGAVSLVCVVHSQGLASVGIVTEISGIHDGSGCLQIHSFAVLGDHAFAAIALALHTRYSNVWGCYREMEGP